MADLPIDQSRVLAALMLELHGDFRRRHGLPPFASAWTLGDEMKALAARASLVDTGVIRSRARLIGTALTAARRVLWEVLKPLFHRQTEVNRDLILAIEALARDREDRHHVHRALSERISSLEAAVARLHSPGE